MIDPLSILIDGDGAGPYEELRDAGHRTLAGPEDDMWATFADLADPFSLTWDEGVVGRFSVDAEKRLHGFYVAEKFRALSVALLARLIGELDVAAAMTSTVDPEFLSLCLAHGATAEPMALMYDHVGDPESQQAIDLHRATTADHAAAVAFSRSELGSPTNFLDPYLSQRIDLGELYLVKDAGRIRASGELRVDRRTPGNAHLGFVVAADSRGQGLGSRLMRTLTGLALEQELTPRCSTEPTNVAAQRAIVRAGFRHRHTVLRCAWGTADEQGPDAPALG